MPSQGLYTTRDFKEVQHLLPGSCLSRKDEAVKCHCESQKVSLSGCRKSQVSKYIFKKAKKKKKTATLDHTSRCKRLREAVTGSFWRGRGHELSVWVRMVLAALGAAVQELQQVFLCDRKLDAVTYSCKEGDRKNCRITIHVMTNHFLQPWSSPGIFIASTF